MISNRVDCNVDKIYISSDIKLSLNVRLAQRGEGVASVECFYPEDVKIQFAREIIDETLCLKVVRIHSLFSRRTVYCEFTLVLPAALSDLKVDAANAAFQFSSGCIDNCTINIASGSIELGQNFIFKKCFINAANGDVKVIAPSCFESISINMATGSASVSLPSTERVECVQKVLSGTSRCWSGPLEGFEGDSKKLTLQGALLKSTVLSH